ncbi:polyprenol dehydrogenase-like [Apostichopus japonicus]|uniref:polyprenol dehydrogenase-like n=1 Tax=Stichopus japonicus TaxID=307972 RepID=UPI003AB31CA4
MGAKPSVPDDQLPPDRTFIVTGGNTGIGYETAKTIAQLGGRVIIACRNEEKAKFAIERMIRETQEEHSGEKTEKQPITREVPELNIQYMNLDLSSFNSTIEFVREFKDRGLPLHVLICNAGTLNAQQKCVTKDGFELHFQVNYLSHFLLTLLLLPLLKESAPNSRIVNVSSVAHLFGEVIHDNIQDLKSHRAHKFYLNSKLFQVMNMYCLSRKLTGQGISVLSVHPGFVDTDVFREGTGCVACSFSSMICCWGVDAKEGSRSSLIAALDPKYDGTTAHYFDRGRPSNSSRLSRDEAKQEILWKYSLQCLREQLSDVILQEIGEKLEDIEPLSTS